jgi:ribosomal protein S27AE
VCMCVCVSVCVPQDTQCGEGVYMYQLDRRRMCGMCVYSV